MIQIMMSFIICCGFFIQVPSLASSDKVASNDHKLLYLEATEWYRNSVHYWPFEEVSNGTAKDYVGSNDGRINGGFNAVSGLVGSALELTGNETYVDFGVLPSSCLNRPSTCRSGFTIAFWMKIPNFQGNKIVLQLGQHRFSRGFTLWTRRGLKKNVGFSVNTLHRKYDWVQDWYNDHWNHVALKWDNNTGILSIYSNCTIVKVVNESHKATPIGDDKASRLILGASHAKRKNMRLMIDEFAIWNRTVSDDTLCKVFQTRSVSGNYSEWSKFSPCSVSCGNGTMTRIRSCTSPSPKNRGRRCSTLGASEETKSCFLTECLIHGNYSAWSVFSTCSKTCGNGNKTRTRNCSNPKPKHGGRDCLNLGLGIEVKDCNTQPCPINGGYTKWTEFSQCSVSCGSGTRQRNRSCSNPQPMHGGKNCSHLGLGVEIEICNTNLCPIHGGFSEWTIFSKCTKSCGNGTQQRTRKCSNPKPKLGGRDCSSLGPLTDTRKCSTHHCPINGGYTPWTQFTHCSRTCGIGTKKRQRSCSNPKPKYGGSNCTHLGAAEDVKNCILRRWCPVNGGFTEWSKFSECTRSCGVGIKNRTRYCTNPVPMHGGKDCTGIRIDITVCNVDPCPVDGDYSPWSKFSTCTRTCANGTMRRTRNCSNPAPQFNGKNCSFLGPPIEIRNCNTFPCPIDGNYSSWSNFSVCSKSCGNGTMEKIRKCSSPTPRHGGKNCSLLGPSKEVRECNLFPCPVDGNFSSWSIFTVCSKSCGNGTKTRTRNCSNPAPKHEGKNCSLIGPLKEVRSCNVFPCPIHGNYSTWSNFSVCSESCGNGTMTRYRNCTEPEPRYNGNNCSSLGPSIDIRSCNVFPCPVDGGYSSWGHFTPCTLSCGIGTMYRTRNCSSPVPQFGGKNCSKIGPAMEEKTCNERPCPIDGGYTSWSEFSQCSKSCGNGTARRTRQCSNPVPQFGGHNCSKFGSDIDFQQCYLRPCPIDGGYGDWSNYTECTQSCNGGTQKRTRQCNNPAPKHGGRNCSSLGPKTDEQPCNTFPCPIHGGYSQWTGFESCTRTCGGGMLIRRRNCTNPPPAHGGRDCSNLGPRMESIECNTQKCPNIVFKVTVNLTSEKWDESLATEKSSRKRDWLILKIQIGVTDIMGENAVSAVTNFSFRQGSVIAEFSISLFHRYYHGITRLQDAINMEGKIEDTLPVSPVNLTSPDVPVMPPRSITAVNISSTAILLTWLPIPSAFSNGRIVEYRITYFKAENMGVTLRDKDSWQTVIDGEKLSYNITGLERFTNYRFRMAGINRRGVGVDSEPTTARTDEDKPSSSPSIIKASSNGSTAIYVEWSPVSQHLVHGILLGYHIHYSNLDPEGYGDVSMGSHPTGPANSSTFLKSLLKFTSYRIQVSAFTVKGDGPLSDAAIIQTDEDVPSKPPANVTGNNVTSTSIEVRWNPIPPRFTHGILLGYKVSYLATDLGNNRKWNESVVNQSTTSVIISNLRKFTTYMVSLEGLTSKGNGIESKCVKITTAEDKPDAFPENVTGFNTSSTSLFMEWQHIPWGQRNGILQGYRITYYPKKSRQPVKHKTVDSTRSSTTLSNLKKFTWYVIEVAGYTSKGLGPHPPRPLEIRTSEDVPSKPVMTLKARNTSHTSLLVEWSDIPRDSVHGILLGFRVIFWRSNESRATHEIIKTGPDKSSVHLKDLWIYTKYKIQILGFTAAGTGAVSKELEVSTDEFTPSQSPINVQALNKTHPTKIVVHWYPIPDSFYVHGILRGYKVFYKAIAIANEELEEELETNQVTVSSSNLSAVLENLNAFTKYRIEVLAFTVKGDGVKSIPVTAETCNCHSSVFTNWWINPPYVDRPDSNKSGIIPPILKESVFACCGNCTDHGTTRIDFDYSASRRPAKKSGLVQFKRNFEENTELQFPVYGFMDQTRFSDNYGFVPFVQSPGLALIIIGDEKGTAATLLLKSLAFCFPILFLSIAMLWVSSLAMWFVETASNERHFPRNILHGSWEAMWWAFASMTTLGYGDRIPRTPFGRLVCLSWILLGLVMLTCFNSTMTTLLTARILDKDVPLYGTKIAAIQNSSGYRIAIRKNARVNPNGKEYTNLQEVYNALINREVKGMLVDAFTVGSKKHLFNRRDLRISKLLDYKAAYGVVLGGEAKKLQKCLQKYVSEQRSEISKIVEKNVESIEITPKSMSVERSGSLFDPQFPTYVRAVIVCGVLLCVLWLVGAKFEFAKKMGWIKFRRKDPSESYSLPRRVELMRHKEELKAEMSRIVAIFKINCSRRIQVLRQRHKKELLHLAKLKKQADSVVIRKGSLRRDSFFSFAFALKTPEMSNGSDRNGHTKHDSSLKHDFAEVETMV